MLNRSEVPEFIHEHWNWYLPEHQFSAQDFYARVEERLKERKVPEIVVTRVEFSQVYSILSGKREYLRVRNGPYSFDICAAPYGTGFFVSWWMGEDLGCLIRILFLVPFLGTYLKRKMFIKTYYVIDMEDMFMAVHCAVTDTVDSMTDAKGLRALSPEEKRLPRRKRIGE